MTYVCVLLLLTLAASAYIYLSLSNRLLEAYDKLERMQRQIDQRDADLREIERVSRKYAVTR